MLTYKLKNLRLLSFLWLVVGYNSTIVFSQSVANYTISRATSVTYTSISGAGASEFIWRNNGTNYNDDNRSYSTPIGFDFWYLGTRYTTFCSSLNGYIDVSASTANGNGVIYGPNHNNQFSIGGTNGTMLAFAPMYDDLWVPVAGTAPIAGNLIYKTSGTEPNRVLTVEWIGFEVWKNAPYWTSPPSMNFQVKLYETSGRIEFAYGNMNPGNAGFSYACGINNFWTPAAAPSASLLLTQQTANSTTFNNTPSDALTTVPASNSRIYIDSPPPSAAPSALSFSNVTKTSMNLFWNDNANNELGYVILNSTNGTNFSFVTQLATGSTSANVSGLFSGTTYYWKVHALTDGNLGAAVTGTQATLASGAVISVATGSWSNPATWNCACVPSVGDNVTIANGHNVILDTDGECLGLNVGQGTSGSLTFGNNGTGRSLMVNGNLLVQSGATLITSNTNATHSMTITGNLTNNGIVNLSTTASRVCNITFNKDGNQTISGTGATNFYNRIIIDKGTNASNILEVSSSTFAVRPTNFLTLTNGTFKLSSPTASLTPFTAAVTLSISTGIWLNHTGATLLTGNTVNLFGNIRCTAGTFIVGDANNENLIVSGGNILIDGGNLGVAGRIGKPGFTALTNFTLSSGTVTVGRVGSTTANEATFRMDENGSVFNMTGGSLIVQRSGASNLGYVNTSTTNVTVTGGTLFIGSISTPANETITINSPIPIQNIEIGSSVAVTASLHTNPLNVNNQLSINTGTLFANDLPISLQGNWVNNGYFDAGNSSVTFSGTSGQQISGASTTTFNTLIVSNASGAGLTCATPVNLTGTLTLNTGRVFTSSTNLMTLLAGAAATNGSSASFVSGPLGKVGATDFVFPVGKGTNWRRTAVRNITASSTFVAEYFNSSFSNTLAVNAPMTNISKVEYWQVDRPSGSGNANLSLFWENAAGSGINNCTDLTIARWNGSSWDERPATTAGGSSCVGAGTGTVSTTAALTAFSPFTFGSKLYSANPLPVQLLDFGYVCRKNQIELNWSTASERNNAYFAVERSSDGENWIDIGHINGAQNSEQKKVYTYSDNISSNEINYYRLSQVDIDQRKETFNTVAANCINTEDKMVLHPNPTTSELNVIFNSTQGISDAQIKIVDFLGKINFQQSVSLVKGNNMFKLPLQLNPGAYTLIFVSEKLKVPAQKLVIQ